jgi:hypothetical protein
MNKRIAKTLLVLCIAYIVGYYILKFIFPEQLILVVTDANIIRLGRFVDSHIVYKIILNVVTTFTTLLLFTFASSGRFKFKWYEILYILVGTTMCELCAWYSPQLYTHTSISVMFILAWLCKGKMVSTIISFVVHGYLSQFLFSIRGFETILMNYTTITGIVLTIECYAWLLILALFFNIKGGNNYAHGSTISK